MAYWPSTGRVFALIDTSGTFGWLGKALGMINVAEFNTSSGTPIDFLGQGLQVTVPKTGFVTNADALFAFPIGLYATAASNNFIYTGRLNQRPRSPGSVTALAAVLCIVDGQYRMPDGTCIRCPPGSYCPNRNDVLPCTEGSFSNSSSMTSCSDCPAGWYQSLVGQSACIACDVGRFSGARAATSATSCQACRPGSFSESGSSLCKECSNGTFQVAAGQGSCIPCESGKYAATQGQTFCSVCDLGWVAPNVGAQNCSSCMAGSFAASPALPCMLCDSGRYSDSANQTTCLLCKEGATAVERGSVNCTACGPGTFAWTCLLYTSDAADE